MLVLWPTRAVCHVLVVFHTVSMVTGSDHRMPDKLFSNETRIKGRTVSCDSVPRKDANFPAETWSCYDIRVDDMRVQYYWNMPGFGTEGACSNNDGGSNDIPALCRELLVAHGYQKDLWTAYISDLTCDTSPGDRVIFTPKDGVHQWETFGAGRGYARTIRCMGME